MLACVAMHRHFTHTQIWTNFVRTMIPFICSKHIVSKSYRPALMSFNLCMVHICNLFSRVLNVLYRNYYDLKQGKIELYKQAVS